MTTSIVASATMSMAMPMASTTTAAATTASAMSMPMGDTGGCKLSVRALHSESLSHFRIVPCMLAGCSNLLLRLCNRSCELGRQMYPNWIIILVIIFPKAQYRTIFLVCKLFIPVLTVPDAAELAHHRCLLSIIRISHPLRLHLLPLLSRLFPPRDFSRVSPQMPKRLGQTPPIQVCSS